MDFLIQLVPTVGGPPVFDQPPTPTCGSTQTVFVGNTMSFTVQAHDPDVLQPVTLNATGLPPGATMTPALPFTGVAGMPVPSTFNWTPSAGGTFVLSFTATDSTAQQALLLDHRESDQQRHVDGDQACDQRQRRHGGGVRLHARLGRDERLAG